jgi:hypothetical protein
MGRACSMYGERRRAYRGLVQKLEGRTHERPKRRWENDIKMDHPSSLQGQYVIIAYLKGLNEADFIIKQKMKSFQI